MTDSSMMKGKQAEAKTKSNSAPASIEDVLRQIAGGARKLEHLNTIVTKHGNS